MPSISLRSEWCLSRSLNNSSAAEPVHNENTNSLSLLASPTLHFPCLTLMRSSIIMSISADHGECADTVAGRAQWRWLACWNCRRCHVLSKFVGVCHRSPRKMLRLVCINVTPEMFHLREMHMICIASDRIKVAARLPRFSSTGRWPAFMNSLETTPEPHMSATVIQTFIDLAGKFLCTQ